MCEVFAASDVARPLLTIYIFGWYGVPSGKRLQKCWENWDVFYGISWDVFHGIIVGVNGLILW